MERIIRLTYASTATFKNNQSGGIEADVARILVQSRNNNSRAKVGGVLHYGNGYFFQCLEGETSKVNETYNRISKDPRHKNVQLLAAENIGHRMFSDWSMKYMPIESSIKTLLEKYGYETFDPYKFDAQFVEQLLAQCVKGVDLTESVITNKSKLKLNNNANDSAWSGLMAKLKRVFS
ncbi:MAG: hypothetical protein ACJAYF_000939 [Arenicella sp.]|jgi:hypothetical protein